MALADGRLPAYVERVAAQVGGRVHRLARPAAAPPAARACPGRTRAAAARRALRASPAARRASSARHAREHADRLAAGQLQPARRCAAAAPAPCAPARPPGRAGSSRRSSARDLLGVGHALLRLLAERRLLVERPHEQLAAQRLQALGECAVGVLGGRSAPRRRGTPGPSSSPAVRRMMLTPVRSSPAMIARSTGAAPRQRGSSDGCTLRIGCAASRRSPISAPNAQTITAGGPGRLAGRRDDLPGGVRLVDALGLRERAGRGAARRRRPAGCAGAARARSCGPGRVTTSAGRWRACAASRSSTAAAKPEVPR